MLMGFQMWSWFCALPDFFLAWFSQDERCATTYLRDDAPPRLVLFAIGAWILFVLAFVWAVRRTLLVVDTNSIRWWYAWLALFAIATVSTKLTACH